MIKLLILQLFSITPVLSITSDKTFGGPGINNDKRFSLFRISFGVVKIYFLTIYNGQFRLIECLNINNLRPWPEYAKSIDKRDKYSELINNASEDELSINNRFLENKIERENSTKNSFQVKLNTYNSIVLLLSGYIAYLFKEVIIFYNNSFLNIIMVVSFALIAINYLNCLLFIYEYTKNKNVSRSTFVDIKNNPTAKALSASYYYDWYNIKCERDVLSNYIKNIEKYLFKTVMFVLLFSIIFSLYNGRSIAGNEIQKNHNKKNPIELIDQNGKFADSKLDEIQILLNDIASQNINTVFIIQANLARNKDKYLQVSNTLNLFAKDKVAIVELDISGSQNNNEILIIKPAN